MKESGNPQDSSSLFHSVLVCFSEAVINMDRLETEHVCLLVRSLRAFSLCSNDAVITSTCTITHVLFFSPN